MNLRPKKTKYRKAFKGKIKGISSRCFTLNLGEFGLKALEAERIKDKQIEASRKAIRSSLKKSGKLWIRIFPNIPVTKKPTDVRMGKGKGSVEDYIFRVKPGRILFELSAVSEEEARKAFELAAKKLPIKTKFIKSHCRELL